MESLKRLSIVFLCMLSFYCSSQESGKNIQVDNQLEVKEILKKNEKQKNLIKKTPIGFYFTTESDFVSKSDSCYVTNVRVYRINSVTTEKILLTSEKVLVGDCPPEKTEISNKNN